MTAFDPHETIFWDAGDARAEMTRVFDICNGCRLCDNLCLSFTDLFDTIDAIDDAQERTGRGAENPARALGTAEFTRVTDECYQCKLCYVKCPYTPPHEYMLDFPRLLLRWQAIQSKQRRGSALQSLALGNTHFVGSLAARAPALVNWANANPALRWAMEKTTGIHRKKKLPAYRAETFEDWHRNRRAPPALEKPAGKAALFYTCTVNYNAPELGRKCVEILEHNSVEVAVPPQVCCGMPQLGTADYPATTKAADENTRTLKRFVDDGYTIVTPGPSCGYMLRQEYPHLAMNAADAGEIAKNTMDICEYLMKLHEQKLLKTDFREVNEKITYHLPCHLKAQNIGFKSRDLLSLIPGVAIATVQQCSGHDGTWSMKKEFYELSLETGKKLASRIEREMPAALASDCLLAHLHIEELTGEKAKHPVEILHAAYGLNAEV